eukprot:1062528-Prorocentrum_minimum.AAC.1
MNHLVEVGVEVEEGRGRSGSAGERRRRAAGIVPRRRSDESVQYVEGAASRVLMSNKWDWRGWRSLAPVKRVLELAGNGSVETSGSRPARPPGRPRLSSFVPEVSLAMASGS